MSPDICPFGPQFQKYWNRRYDLFSKFDEGIQLDEVSLYQTTPEEIALHQAKKMNCKTIVDAFCGAGGNAIAFAKVCDKVIAIELNPERLEMAKNNAKIYGVYDKIEFILGDFFQEAPKYKTEGVFLDPLWGGPSYKKLKSFKLIHFHPNGSDILREALMYFKKTAFKVPENFDFGSLKGFSEPYTAEDNILKGKLFFKTIYFG